MNSYPHFCVQFSQQQLQQTVTYSDKRCQMKEAHQKFWSSARGHRKLAVVSPGPESSDFIIINLMSHNEVDGDLFHKFCVLGTYKCFCHNIWGIPITPYEGSDFVSHHLFTPCLIHVMIYNIWSYEIYISLQSMIHVFCFRLLVDEKPCVSLIVHLLNSELVLDAFANRQLTFS